MRDSAAMLLGGLAFGVVLWLACCAPRPAPSADAAAPAGAGPCEAACSNLKRLGCPEGGDRCAHRCEVSEGLFDLRPACLADAGTPDAARACGTVRCTGR